MNIIYLSACYPGKPGGQSSHIMGFATSLLDQFPNTKIYITGCSVKNQKIILDSNLSSICIFLRKIKMSILFLYFLVFKSHNLKIYARSSPFFDLSILISSLLTGKSQRLDFYEVNGVKKTESYTGIANMLSFFFSFLDKFAYSRTKKIICVSVGVLDYVNNNFPHTKCLLVTNGYDPSYFYPVQSLEKEYLKEYLLLSELKDKKVISFIGSFAKWQNFNAILNAFDKYIIDNPFSNLYLLFVGDGPLLSETISYSKSLRSYKRIKFLGSIKYSQVHFYFKISDFGLLLDQRTIISSPIKMHEYLACNVPCISLPQQKYINSPFHPHDSFHLVKSERDFIESYPLCTFKDLMNKLLDSEIKMNIVPSLSSTWSSKIDLIFNN